MPVNPPHMPVPKTVPTGRLQSQASLTVNPESGSLWSGNRLKRPHSGQHPSEERADKIIFATQSCSLSSA